LSIHGWDWLLIAVGAFLVGLAKTGIMGLSLLFVLIFNRVIPGKASTGFVLPLLIVGDIVAVVAYRRHAQWGHLWKLFPWAGAGVILGYFAMERMDVRQSQLAICAIVLALAVLHIVRRLRPNGEEAEHGAWFAPVIGILAGFTTLIANAAGPLMVIYLLAMRLPKMEYMGTASVFFLLLNFFKLPFMVRLGIITPESLVVNLKLVPAVLLGAWLGRRLLARLNQKVFEAIVLALTLLAGARLFF
jgi:uncharacterized membrane protein YfcA